MSAEYRSVAIVRGGIVRGCRLGRLSVVSQEVCDIKHEKATGELGTEQRTGCNTPPRIIQLDHRVAVDASDRRGNSHHSD